MPRLPTIRVIGSQDISTSWPGSRLAVVGSGTIVVIEISPSEMLSWEWRA
ncbi:quinone oxidoreductase domain protein [Mycobacterium kansasii 732]|nr:quinone oxidoreductase domain protein [Mycobacterium kansasii 732]